MLANVWYLRARSDLQVDTTVQVILEVAMKISKIRYISPMEENDPVNDNIDVHVHLDDGRVYSFVVGTPSNMYSYMKEENLDYFVGIPFLLVKRITPENIERALQALVSEYDGRWLNTYGTLQCTKVNEIDD
jgi:hypothetical protein